MDNQHEYGHGHGWTIDNRQNTRYILTINLYEKTLNIWMCICSRSNLVFHQTGDGGYRTFEIKIKFSFDSNVEVLFVFI